MMKRDIFVFALSLALVTPAAVAEVKPISAGYDQRILNVDYNPDDVVKIIGHFGYSTVIEFDSAEEVLTAALGDSLAWEVAPRSNMVFLKPRENQPSTNMTVVTNRRVYHFRLEARNNHRGAVGEHFFAVRFQYPQDVVKHEQEEAQRRAVQLALEAEPIAQNWNYWACGNRVLRPTEVYDDGRFTYLRFPAAQEIPAAFVVNPDGSEALANGTMRGDQLVLQAVARKIILRAGRATSCLENRSFNFYGTYTPTNTTSPRVERVLKDSEGVQQVLPAVPANDHPAPPPESEVPAIPGMPTIPGMPPYGGDGE